ncbi:hypothetical protein EI42_04477 [Thermosporothrix hazakensis]|jgi:hypothetical protein|uniref:Uncharacterized protein n=1 Tax=Thermosporothrix hazakensis TaxID=644383 RepID=A0A326U5B1_THEHA|nr:hypothetical protein EI42_04477 [Thermosporothrix hazakensis]
MKASSVPRPDVYAWNKNTLFLKYTTSFPLCLDRSSVFEESREVVGRTGDISYWQ